MHKLSAFYVTLALLLVGLPAGLALYDATTAVLVLIGLALLVYLYVLVLLTGCFWCRWRHGIWPLFFGQGDDPAPEPSWGEIAYLTIREWWRQRRETKRLRRAGE